MKIHTEKVMYSGLECGEPALGRVVWNTQKWGPESGQRTRKWRSPMRVLIAGELASLSGGGEARRQFQGLYAQGAGEKVSALSQLGSWGGFHFWVGVEGSVSFQQETPAKWRFPPWRTWYGGSSANTEGGRYRWGQESTCSESKRPIKAEWKPSEKTPQNQGSRRTRQSMGDRRWGTLRPGRPCPGPVEHTSYSVQWWAVWPPGVPKVHRVSLPNK